MVSMRKTPTKTGACKGRKLKGKCSKPGPITTNGYLNFIRDFRKKNCGLKPRVLISKAAAAWNALPEKEKDKYRVLACKISEERRKLKAKKEKC